MRAADSIDGGTGDDIIYFDELDTIDGGDGWDVAIYSSNLNTSSVDLDAVEHHLEVVIAGLGNDTLSTDGSTETHLAGLDGDDVFNITGGGGAPTIVWGGPVRTPSTFPRHLRQIRIPMMRPGSWS